MEKSASMVWPTPNPRIEDGKRTREHPCISLGAGRCPSVRVRKGARRRWFDAEGVEIESPKASGRGEG